MALLSDLTVLPVSLGHFRVVRELGVGGSSRVYLCERIGSFSQRVAIKILHGLHSTSGVETEHRALSSLEHENIVRLLDQRLSDAGQHYLVMEYVDGLPIDQFCDANRLSIPARIRLLIEVMAGVGYAHRHMIVHADLKPSNILVNSQGEPKLLDFGIAAMLGCQAMDTDVEHPGFTPAYASPEQMLGGSLSVASDVYSLGVVATVLLAGITPVDETGMTPLERLRRLEGNQLGSLADARSMSKSALLRTLAGDLEAILENALQTIPENRYGTVAAFCDDLKNYLDGRPIAATPATIYIRVFKWVRRHSLVASLSAALLISISLSVAGVTVQTARAAAQRRVTQTQLQDLVRLTGELDGELFDSARPLAASDAARKTLLQGATKTLDQLTADDSGDPEVAIGVAQQYERLAQSWLSLGEAGDYSVGQASTDVDHAISLLENLPESSRTSAAVKQQWSELIDLKNKLKR
jgi:serine/threonine protein kinase